MENRKGNWCVVNPKIFCQENICSGCEIYLKQGQGTKVKWLKSRCECGREYEYPEGGYKTKTCGAFECVQANLHPEIKRRK